MRSPSPNPTGDKCPRCGGNSLRRSRRSRFERAFSALPYLPYLCLDCQARFWRRVPRIPPTNRPGRVSGIESRHRRFNSSRRQFIVYSIALILLLALTSFLTRYTD